MNYGRPEVQRKTLSVAVALGAVMAVIGCGGGGGTQSADSCGGAPPAGAVVGTFQMSSPSGGSVSQADRETTLRTLCARAKALGLDHAVVRQSGEEIQILLSGRGAATTIAEIARPAELYLYDWEANVIPDVALKNVPSGEASFPNYYSALSFASQRSPECFEGACTTPGPSYYLVDSQKHRWLAGPADTKQDLFASPGKKQPQNTKVLTVPQGTLVVQREATPGASHNPNLADWFVIRDRPSLTGGDLVNPNASLDQFRQPDVVFNFTNQGRQKFTALTKTIAERGLLNAPAAVRGNAVLADQYSGHFAVVVDHQVKSRPIINFLDNPNGNDGRFGAEINGLGEDQARTLADLLKAGGQLPVLLAASR